MIDENVIHHFMQGKQSAFDEIFRQFYRPLCVFAYGMVKDRQAAEDIVQDFFVKFWENRAEFQLQQQLNMYFYKAIQNNCIHYLNKQKKQSGESALKLLKSEFVDNKDMEQLELENHIHNAIEELPTECRKIFKMSRFDELKNREIAEKLNISIKTVENQMTKALKFIESKVVKFL